MKKNILFKQKLNLSLLILFFVSNIPQTQAQGIEHVLFAVFGSSVIVSYDLVGGSPDNLYTVDLFLSTGGAESTQAVSPLEVSGDIGFGIHPGKSKSIKWQPRKSINYPAVSFKVTATYTRSANDKRKYVDDFMQMVAVEGGTFEMGSNDYPDSKPIHTVKLSSFYIGKYEVTQKQWFDIMGTKPSYPSYVANYPVQNVTWYDVQEYIKRLNEKSGNHYRLPTESEWEFAARGGKLSKGYVYAGSNTIGEVAWYRGFNKYGCVSVGGKQPNELGVFDMSGNVREWCSDAFSNYPAFSQIDPLFPVGEKEVIRGGSRMSSPEACHTTYRESRDPSKAYYDLGFRLAL